MEFLFIYFFFHLVIIYLYKALVNLKRQYGKNLLKRLTWTISIKQEFYKCKNWFKNV